MSHPMGDRHVERIVRGDVARCTRCRAEINEVAMISDDTHIARTVEEIHHWIWCGVNNGGAHCGDFDRLWAGSGLLHTPVPMPRMDDTEAVELWLRLP